MEPNEKEKKESKKEGVFTAKKVAVMAVFTALAYAVSLLDFPVFPAASFLKLDFGNVFILLVGFLFGPVEGIVVCVIKEAIHVPFGTTGGVGELANVILTVSFLLIPSLVYRFKKGLKVVIPSLAAAIVLTTGMGLITNRFLLFPLYMGAGAGAAFASLWYYIVFFNLIKGAAIALVTCLLYKRLSRFLSRF